MGECAGPRQKQLLEAGFPADLVEMMDCTRQRQTNVLEAVPGDAVEVMECLHRGHATKEVVVDPQGSSFAPNPSQRVSPFAPTGMFAAATPATAITQEQNSASQVRFSGNSSDDDVDAIREELQQTIYPQLQDLRYTLAHLQSEFESVLAEAKKPQHMQLFQQFHDRLSVQEQKQKEQDDLIKELLEDPIDKKQERARAREFSSRYSDGEEDAADMLQQLQVRRRDLQGRDAEQRQMLTSGNDVVIAGGSNVAATAGAPATGAAAAELVSAHQHEMLRRTSSGGDPPLPRQLPVYRGQLQPDSPGQAETSAKVVGFAAAEEEVVWPDGSRSVPVSEATAASRSGRKKKKRPPPLLAKAGSGITVQTHTSKATRQTHGSHGSTSRKVRHPLPQLGERPWNASVWEASLLVFVKGVGSAASLHMLMLLAANILVQLSFAAVALFNFNDATFTDKNLEESRMFRLSFGHNVRFQDSLSQRSLMRRVCDGGFSLEMGTKPGQLVEDISDYLALDADPGMERFFAGQLMCFLAVGCWAMVFVAEFDRAFSLCWALLSIQLQEATGFLANEDESLQLEGLSFDRYILAAFLTVVRLTISVMLLVVGCLWLVYTVNVETLLLNAVALGFVLEVDTMLFVMAPSQVRGVISKLQPMPMRRFFSWKGADIASTLLTIFVVTVGMITLLAYIEPQTNKMEEIYDILCNGTVDFVYTQDTIGITYVSPAKEVDGTNNRARLARQSVEEVISFHVPLDEVQRDVWLSTDFKQALIADRFADGLFPAEIIRSYSVAELVDMLNPLCIDQIWDALGPLRQNFIAITGLDIAVDALNCSILGEWHHESTVRGIYTRAACPQVSGCMSPLSPVPSLSPSWGCPSACTTNVEIALQALPCVDTPLSTLLNGSYWQSWAKHIGLMANEVHTNGDNITNQLISKGCEGLADIETVSLPTFSLVGMCSGEWDMHPLAHACPVACGCAIGITQKSISVCPEACVTQVLG